LFFYFIFNTPSSTQIYTLSLHDALPICEFIELSSKCREPFSLCKISQFREARPILGFKNKLGNSFAPAYACEFNEHIESSDLTAYNLCNLNTQQFSSFRILDRSLSLKH